MVDNIIYAKYNQDNCLKNHIITKVIAKESYYEIVVEALTAEAEKFIKTIEGFELPEELYKFFKEKYALHFVIAESHKNDLESIIDSIEKKLLENAVNNSFFSDPKYQYFEKYEKIFVDIDDYLNAHAHVELEKKHAEEQLEKEKEEKRICDEIIEKQKEQIKNLEEELEAITNSKSWNLTKPIRSCVDALNKKGV